MELESDLSKKVSRHWGELGYCVHGEVDIFGKREFIDHVCHTGPCHDPDYVVAVEMKRSATQPLLNQLHKLDVYHLVDELWGVTISSPNSSSLDRWDNPDLRKAPYFVTMQWSNYGLMSWDNGFHIHRKPSLISDKYFKSNVDDLLLVDENKGIKGGESCSEGTGYCTYWSVSKNRIKEWIFSGSPTFTTKDLYNNLPETLDYYSDGKATARKMVKSLVEDGDLLPSGKDGRYNKYIVIEED